MTVTLDSETIKTLLSPAGATDLVSALYKAQYQKSLLRLHQLHRKLSLESAELVRRTRFSEAFEHLGSTSPPAQAAVISYPSFAFWLDVAWEKAEGQVHLSNPDGQMSTHLEDFGRFVLAAKSLSGFGEFECTVKADQHGRIVLPGTATYLENQEPCGLKSIRVMINDGAISILVVDGRRKSEVKVVSRTIPKLRFGAEFNAIDRDLRLPGHSTFTYEQVTLLDSVRWVSILNDAWGWVVDHESLLSIEMLLIVRAFVPVTSHTRNVHTSGSFREAPGLIALSWDPDVPVLAEALVHEYHHQKLNALLNLDPLIIGPTTAPIYYSPWRTDPRPLLGVLHGVYTFHAVLRFWIKVLVVRSAGIYEPSIRRRIYTLNSQLQTALTTLQENAIWSTLGETFFGAIVDSINELTPALPKTELRM